MRTKKVNRYWCDFCNKAGGSAGAMRNHEKHCTLNPNRECKVCMLIEESSTPTPMHELLSLLPDSAPYHADYSDTAQHGILFAAVNAAMPALREVTKGCPACIMAALRQAKIPVPMVETFDFKVEMKTLFSELNADRECNYAY